MDKIRQELKMDNPVALEKIPYCERFNIDLSEVDDMIIYEWNLSVRTRNCLKKERINTIFELLRYNEEKLLNITNFGVKSLKEIEDKISSLKKVLLDQDLDNCGKSKYKIPRKFRKYIDYLVSGNFDFICNLEIKEVEMRFLERFQKETDLIDNEIRMAAIKGNNSILLLSNMLRNFNKEINKKTKYKNQFEDVLKIINHSRLNQLVEPYLKNYDNEILYNIVQVHFPSMRVGDTIKYAKIVMDFDVQIIEVVNFLKWISFDIDTDFKQFINNSTKYDRDFLVIKHRAEGETLEVIGEALGVTRERIRQIEKKIVNKTVEWLTKYRLVDKVFALNGNIQLIKLDEFINQVNTLKLEFEYIFLKYLETLDRYEYIPEISTIVLKDNFETEKLNEVLSALPAIFDLAECEVILSNKTLDQIYIDVVKIYIETNYNKSGKVYHKKRLNLTDMYKRVLFKYYKDGLRIFDNNAMQLFKRKLKEEYGDIDLPESDRAIAARISDFGVLCDRGTYKIADVENIDEGLKGDIYNYILTSNREIILTNSIFKLFEDQLVLQGINNHYFLHGILREVFVEEFYFKKDCIMKDRSSCTISDEIIRFIEGFDFPITQNRIREEFPGATEAIINRTVSLSNIVNLFGRYIHISKIGLDETKIVFIDEVIEKIVSDGKVHHAKDLYNTIENLKPNFWKQIFVEYPFGAFNVAEIVFSSKYQFERPFLSLKGVDISGKEELLRIEAEKSEQVSVRRLHEMAKKYKLHFTSIYSLIEILFDTHYLINKEFLIKEEMVDISKEVIVEVESMIIPYVEAEGTSLIRFLPCVSNMPNINYKWDEWLIFSVIKKYSSKLDVALSSNFYAKAYPIISIKNEIDCDKYYEIQIDEDVSLIHNMNDIDELLDELVELEL